MRVSVKLLGYLRIDLGQKEVDLELPEGASISDGLVRLVEELGPAASRALVRPAGGYNVLFGLNGRAVEPSTPLSDGDVVTLFPPSAGGSDRLTMAVGVIRKGVILGDGTTRHGDPGVRWKPCSQVGRKDRT